MASGIERERERELGGASGRGCVAGGRRQTRGAGDEATRTQGRRLWLARRRPRSTSACILLEKPASSYDMMMMEWKRMMTRGSAVGAGAGETRRCSKKQQISLAICVPNADNAVASIGSETDCLPAKNAAGTHSMGSIGSGCSLRWCVPGLAPLPIVCL